MSYNITRYGNQRRTFCTNVGHMCLYASYTSFVTGRLQLLSRVLHMVI